MTTIQIHIELNGEYSKNKNCPKTIQHLFSLQHPTKGCLKTESDMLKYNSLMVKHTQILGHCIYKDYDGYEATLCMKDGSDCASLQHLSLFYTIPSTRVEEEMDALGKSAMKILKVSLKTHIDDIGRLGWVNM